MSIRYPHKRKGRLTLGKNVSGHEDTSVVIDNTGDIIIGDDVIFSGGCKIFTHDHFLSKQTTIREQTEKFGVKYSNLVIGDDVYFGSNCIVTQNVSYIPKGTVIAAGAVLTENPTNEYEIWGGVPAKKISERK